MALQDLLHMFHHCLLAEPEVQLQRAQGPVRGQPSPCGPLPICPEPHLLLQHVLPLLPHAPYQQWQLWDPASSLHLLHSRVEQCKGSCAAHPGAVVGTGHEVRARQEEPPGSC